MKLSSVISIDNVRACECTLFAPLKPIQYNEESKTKSRPTKISHFIRSLPFRWRTRALCWHFGAFRISCPVDVCVCVYVYALCIHSSTFIGIDNNGERKKNIVFPYIEIGDNGEWHSVQAESIIRKASVKSTATGHTEQREAIKQSTNLKQIHRSDAYSFLCKHIPPPPSSSPPPDDIDDDGLQSPLAISTETLAKLNQLYEMRRYVRHSDIDLNDFNDLLTHRLRKFNELSVQTRSVSLYRNEQTQFSNYLIDREERRDYNVIVFSSSLRCLLWLTTD